MIPVFAVDRIGSVAEVTQDGAVVWGPGTIAHAEIKRDELERNARRKPRNCIRCTTECAPHAEREPATSLMARCN